MPVAFHFGEPARALFGLRHVPPAPARGSILVCMPLLQEGIRCQRALWALSEALAAAGLEVLRFDWFGSGDSGGDSVQLRVDGMVDDIAAAAALVHPVRPPARPRLLALRSAALPLLAHASRSDVPVDVVLWSPVLDGRALVAAWREQHRRQLQTCGRFARGAGGAGDDELLGFVLDPALPAGLETLDARDCLLPTGSRLTLAQWSQSPVVDEFLDRQRAAGVTIERIALDTADAPDWDDPDGFETQLFPRRAVTRLAAALAEAA